MYKKLCICITLLGCIATHSLEPENQSEKTSSVQSVCNSCKNTAQKVGRKLIGHCPNCGNKVEDSLPQKAKDVAHNVYEQAKEMGSTIANKVKSYFTSSCDECSKNE